MSCLSCSGAATPSRRHTLVHLSLHGCSACRAIDREQSDPQSSSSSSSSSYPVSSCRTPRVDSDILVPHANTNLIHDHVPRHGIHCSAAEFPPDLLLLLRQHLLPEGTGCLLFIQNSFNSIVDRHTRMVLFPRSCPNVTGDRYLSPLMDRGGCKSCHRVTDSIL